MALETEADTVAFGSRVAADLSAGDTLALVGDLGAGKTQFTKGIAAGLGCGAAVTSPTFTLVHEYLGGRLPVFHFDFYRLESQDELLDIGWDDYLDARGVVVAEWGDKFPDLLPANTQWWHFTISPDGARTLSLDS